ncbi:exported hypothetical protein [Mesorhizobium sp. SOD10]|nr:exported hypothetical protein [Mesorhizobium sp. SOD10]
MLFRQSFLGAARYAAFIFIAVVPNSLAAPRRIGLLAVLDKMTRRTLGLMGPGTQSKLLVFIRPNSLLCRRGRADGGKPGDCGARLVLRHE